MAIQINGTSGISGVDGSAGTPALQGTDSNTGISFGTDEVNINTGGSTRATVDSSGRLLVGTSTSVSQNIANGTITPQLQNAGTNQSGSTISSVNYNSGGSPAILALGSSTGGTLATQGVVNNNGKLGRIAFTGSDGTTLLTAAEIIAEVDGTPGANDMPGRLVFSTTADGASSPTQRMRIDRSGALSLSDNGTIDPIGSSKVGGFAAGNGASSGAINYYAGNTRALKLGRGNDGEIATFYRNQPSATQVGSINVTTTTTAYNTSSDYRLKENVTAVADGIIRLQQLKPSRFNFIADPGKTVDGFIAHEAQAVVPECVTGTKDEVDADGNPVYQGIDQSKLVPLLTAALQEAIAKIETLEGMVAVNNITIDEQQHQLSTLAARLTALEGGAAQ
jgi:hypothetical protein